MVLSSGVDRVSEGIWRLVQSFHQLGALPGNGGHDDWNVFAGRFFAIVENSKDTDGSGTEEHRVVDKKRSFAYNQNDCSSY